MKHSLTIPQDMETAVRAHLFQNEVEQGAFLFSRSRREADELVVEAVTFYLVPKEGWDVQLDVYLEMKDQERAKIMKMARDLDCGVVDCHSHPDSNDDVWFSPSDRKGITEFAVYAKWKLSGKPYVAMVWGEQSLDGVVWHDRFEAAGRLDQVLITGGEAPTIVVPRGTWFRSPMPFWRQGGEH